MASKFKDSKFNQLRRFVTMYLGRYLWVWRLKSCEIWHCG